ncbi:MAG TPA: ribonucleotide reductase N-terminal alpha domain-containing protein, partial [Phenylobacterium sp.]|nr:ribonucleotide reductase N-terminal alpha domain-containing protein [Phenylobacterium sp.]
MAFDNPLAGEIWSSKYRFDPPGGTGDASVQETWARVADALAQAETEALRPIWRAKFLGALQDFRFLPAGRILAGAGTDRSVTLFNCFVMGRIPDDLGEIFAQLREAAVTLQQGGGVGMDFSSIRPKGARVHGVGADASGPLSFMDVWDAMCRTILSAGQRRGAMMGCLRIDHPDIEAFIEAKREPGRLRNFNLSVLVTDAFMSALEADADWPLVFDGEVVSTVRAADLWRT